MTEQDPISTQAQMLINRVRKNLRRLDPWRRREGISCYRIYDRDIPELPLAIDWYEGQLQIADYAAEQEVSARAIAELAAALGVPPEQAHLKRHRQQKQGGQYEKIAHTNRRLKVAENGLYFWINPTDYLNTGLFLDHRRTRALVRADASGKRMLNLFGYTGAFTVYAAAGGARSTTTVDLSRRYLDWARANMQLNGFGRGGHRFIRNDVFEFLRHATPNRQGMYDLVVLDPPTASKSKKMSHRLDIQRDHPELVNRSLSLCRPGAVVYFSTNFRKFKLSDKELDSSKIEEITALTIPFDFRDKRVHRCWRIFK